MRYKVSRDTLLKDSFFFFFLTKIQKKTEEGFEF